MKTLLSGLCTILLLLLGPSVSAEMPMGATLRRDLAYGADPAQRMDVYLPAPRPPPRPSFRPGQILRR